MTSKVIGLPSPTLQIILDELMQAEDNSRLLSIIAFVLATEHGGSVTIRKEDFEKLTTNGKGISSIRTGDNAITIEIVPATEGLDG